MIKIADLVYKEWYFTKGKFIRFRWIAGDRVFGEVFYKDYSGEICFYKKFSCSLNEIERKATREEIEFLKSKYILQEIEK